MAKFATIYLFNGFEWFVPNDWNNKSNSIQVVGGGGGGSGGCAKGRGAGSNGSSGIHTKKTNVSLRLETFVKYNIGNGGAGGAGGTFSADSGFSGESTWFENESSVCAPGGTAGFWVGSGVHDYKEQSDELFNAGDFGKNGIGGQESNDNTKGSNGSSGHKGLIIIKYNTVASAVGAGSGGFFVKNNGVWQTIKQGWTKDGTTWKLFYTSGEPPPPPPTYEYEYLMAAGGGGGSFEGSGAGAGGVLNEKFTPEYGKQYNIIIGSGGAPGSFRNNLDGSNGENSSFGDIICYGGGGGLSKYESARSNGKNGGCGSGAASQNGPSYVGGSGVEGQGFPGGDVNNEPGSFAAWEGHAGGGGAAAKGDDAVQGIPINGGDGKQTFIRGVEEYFGGGGGAVGNINSGSSPHYEGMGGKGGGGRSYYPTTADCPGFVAGVVNTGGGGGSQWGILCDRTNPGGSGVVIIKEPASAEIADTTGDPQISYYDNWRVYTFTGSGSIILKNPVPPTYLGQALLVSGGGGGTNNGGAAGGGGSDVQKRYFDLEKGKTYIVTVGAGGAGGILADEGVWNNGDDGGVSSISDVATCNPGKSSKTTSSPSIAGFSGSGYSGGRAFTTGYAYAFEGGGGGGAIGAGASSTQRNNGGNGGPGTSKDGFPGTYGGGGGGTGTIQSGYGIGGVGGGGSAAYWTTSGSYAYAGSNGEPNSGGGGGAGIGYYGDRLSPYFSGYNGGSGIVILKYSNQLPQATVTGDPIFENKEGFYWYTFTGSGSFKI